MRSSVQSQLFNMYPPMGFFFFKPKFVTLLEHISKHKKTLQHLCNSQLPPAQGVTVQHDHTGGSC